MDNLNKFVINDLLNDSLDIFDSDNSEKSIINKNTAKRIINPIFKKILANKNILIIGDYDVDGMFSTLELEPYLKLLSTRVSSSSKITTYYTKRELGYSMPEKTYLNLKKEHDFIIFLDTGSSYDYFNKDTKNTLVIDHHPSDKQQFLPFIYNPNIHGNLSTSTGKIVHDIIDTYEDILVEKFGLNQSNLKHDILKYIKILAGITLCSDMARMTAENKIFLDKSLSLMTSNRNLFKWINDIPSKVVTSLDLSFNIINKINSYSRMGKNLKEIENIFKVETSIAKIRRASSSLVIKDLISQMEKTHTLRKDITSALEKEIALHLEKLYTNDKDVLMVVVDNKYTGINGLLSQNLLSKTSKPNLVVSYDSQRDCYVGSGRGTGIKTALNKIYKNNKFLKTIHYGGHNEAIGVSIDNSVIDDFNFEMLNFRFDKKPISEKQDRYYKANGIKEYKQAIQHYSTLSPRTNVDNRYYAVIEKYNNLGVVQKSNGWYCSTLCDENSKLVVYFKEHNIKKIENNKPIMLEITNKENQNYFLEDREIPQKQEMVEDNEENNEKGVEIDVLYS